ncbi:MAG: OmpH family outer membrane protein [Bacteroidales bacterium]
MRKFSGILSIIIVAILVSATFTQCKKKNEQPTSSLLKGSKDTCSSELKVAYINTDSLLNGYDLAKKLNDDLIHQEEGMRANVNERGKNLEKEMAEFQRKYKNNAFLTQERAEQEYQRIMNKQQELQEYVQRLDQESLQNRQKMALRVNDSIQNFINTELTGNFDVILNNAGTFYVTKRLDITSEVIKSLNARYNVKK